MILREIREICGPFDHHGHVVSDIQKAMDDYLAIGIGPWFFITKDRMDRWDEQARAGRASSAPRSCTTASRRPTARSSPSASTRRPGSS